MNRKLSFLAVLTVIVAIFAVTSLVFAAPEVTRVDTASEFVTGTTTSLTVTSGSSIQWYKSETSDGANPVAVGTRDDATLTLTVEEGSFFYFAEVDGETSDIVKVSGYTAKHLPLVFNFSDDTHIEKDGSGDLEFVYDDDVKATVAKVTATSTDPHVVTKDLEIDLSVYKTILVKWKPMVAKAPYMFHAYDGNKSAVSIGGAYPGTSFGNPTAGIWQTFSYGSAANMIGSHKTYSGGRFDYYNNSPAVGDVAYIQYMAAFTDNAQMNEFLLTEKVEKNVIDGKFFEFDDDASLAAEFLPDADYVADEGVTFDSFESYEVFLKSRDKFDLATYSVVKFNYSTAFDAVLTLTYTDANGVSHDKEINLDKSKKSVVVDFTDDADWKGEFVTLSFMTDKIVTVSSIGFVKTQYDANVYDGDQNTPVSASGDLEFESAIWWNMADSSIKSSVQIVNGSAKFNTNTDSGLNTVTFTAKNDGNMSFTYNKNSMASTHRFETSEYPYVVFGYNTDDLNGANAYIKYWTDMYDEPTTVNFTFGTADAPVLASVDEHGFSQFMLDFSSLAAIRSIDSTAANEFRGSLEGLEVGFTSEAGDEIEIAYIVFFADNGQAQRFDGNVVLPPASLVPGTWTSKNVIKSEYITVDDMDLSGAIVEFDISKYSRISRIALQDLKKNYGAKKIVVNGDGYYYEFYPKNVLTNLETWYYDLEVDFNEKNSGDVYRSKIKSLVTEGDYIGGAYFVQKFMKDRSLPFRGKLYYEIGEEYNGKYIDVYTYDPSNNALVLSEHAPVTDGKLVLSTLGGDLAFVDNDYEPTEEELAYAAAVDAYENTQWDAYIYNAGDINFKANNADVTMMTETGITFNRVSSTTADTRVETFYYTDAFEASEYPVVVIKYKTGSLPGTVNNYLSTDFYTESMNSDNYAGYTWYKAAAWYSAGNALGMAADWTTKIVNYTDLASMKASGLNVSGEWVDGAGSDRNSVAYPFKGTMEYYRIDYNINAVGTKIDVAYIAFFKTEEEAKKYVEARDTIENVEIEAAIAEKRANMPKQFIFDLTDPKETVKYTFNTPSDAQPVATESKNTPEGFWTKDSDGEYNLSRSLSATETINLKDYPVLKIKYKASVPGVTQFYCWQSGASVPASNPRADLTFDKAGEWVEQVWDFSSGAINEGSYDGTLTKFRIDPMRSNRVERECTIAYIGFFMTVEDAEAYTGE